MEEQRIELSAGEFAYLEAGRGGRPLLLVHGFTGAKEDFADELDALAERGWHVVAPELRGHGDSVHLGDEAAYSLETFASDLWELLGALGWDRCVLLGHSMGGMVVQLMVLDRPERVERLVLMDTHHGVIETLALELVEIGLSIVRTQGLAALQEVLKLGSDPLVNAAFERTCAERPGYREWADGKMLRCDPAMYAAMGAQFPSMTDRLERLAEVSVPTLVMVGELDAAFVAASEAMANTIADARLDVLAQGGHCPQFEATDAWRVSLYRFLDEAEPPTS